MSITLTPRDVDVSGVSDSAVTINSAINSLPVTGGIIDLPGGTMLLKSGLVIGNGSQAGVSTRYGVSLRGIAPPGCWPSTGLGTSATTLKSGVEMDAVSVRGPLQGWGLQNLHLDGNYVGMTGISVFAAMGGDSKNLLIRNFRGYGLYEASLRATGALVNTVPNTMHNRWMTLYFYVPNINGAHGVYIGGNHFDRTANTCYETFDDLTVHINSPTNGVMSFGIIFEMTDSNHLRNVHMMGTAPNGGACQALRFDHGNIPGFPGGCIIDGIDFGSNSAAIVQAGVPTTWQERNKIINIAIGNGYPGNPLLPKLEWEGINAKAGTPTMDEIPMGEAMIFCDTVGGTTKLYYNNGSTLTSVALT